MSVRLRLPHGLNAPYPEDEAGQMAVELAVVLPIILAVLVIAIDCMVFVSECARFEHVASQVTLAKAVSPAGSEHFEDKERVALVKEELSKKFYRQGEKVKVTSRGSDVSSAGIRIYDLELSMSPWPLGRTGGMLFGVEIPTVLRHSCSLALAPYMPGKFV